MRSTGFIKILDETILESGQSFDTTIDRLMALQGECYQKDSQNEPLAFLCTKKGKLRVGALYSRHRIASNHKTYYVRGQVFTENGKTKVAICTVHDRTAVFLRWFEVLVLVLVVTFYLFIDFVTRMPALLLLIELILGVIFLIAMLTHNNAMQKNKTADLEIMKSEVIRRVEAVKRWDE